MKKGILALTLISAAASVMESAHALPVRGQLNKDQAHGGLMFDVTLGNNLPNYTMNGSTIARPQFSLLQNAPMDFSAVEVKKNDFANGQPRSSAYRNSGVLVVTTVGRRAQNLVLAGVPIRGHFEQGYVDEDLDLRGLTVGNAYSQGTLDYNRFDGAYTPDSNTSFGNFPISGYHQRWAINHDNYSGQDLMRVSMAFGHLIVTGNIQFSNNGTTATTGAVNLEIRKQDGSDIQIAPVDAVESPEEAEVRAFLAFLEIMSHDLASE